MEVYFFSRHEANSEMIDHLGGIINFQFRGNISQIKREGDTISFLDSIEGICKISVNSIIVIVAPLTLQASWLEAGIDTLLVPQNNRQVDEKGVVTFHYSGLLRVKKIIIKTEQWAGSAPTIEQKSIERNQFLA